MVQLHLTEPSALKTALRSFDILNDPVYANKQLGLSGQLETMACDCHQHKSEGPMCGPDSGCINRLTYMECVGDHCGCDETCANRRFQNHEHAKIDVFRAGKKGFGVRALQDIPKGGFIYEYTGEVLDDRRFQRRRDKYDERGVEHFYFMMLQKDEFIDATEKGSVARFCNHSCNPNAAIEKWAVGPRLRMGLFAKRDIKKGEEICFDYKVDRYGATAQPCYCGEPNCSGFLGGRTQTGGVSLPPPVVEGLGLNSDSALKWPESAEQLLLHELELPSADREGVLKNLKLLDQKKRSKTTGLLALLDGSPSSSYDDRDNESGSVDMVLVAQTARNILMKSFEVNEVSEDIPEFLRVLFQTQDRGWLVALMLGRVLKSSPSADSEILRLHGYEIMSTVLNRWKDRADVLVPGLQVLSKWPKVTRNKISSSRIESVVRSIGESEDSEAEVKQLALTLLNEWSNLEMGYRIPKRKTEEPASTADTVPDSAAEPKAVSVDEKGKGGSGSKSEKKLAGPTKTLSDGLSTRVSLKRLPRGWEIAQTDEGRVYYVNKALNKTSREFPKDPRDSEFEAHRRERDRRESERLEAIQRQKEADREAQQEEIRRIIEASSVSAVGSPSVSAIATPTTPAGTTSGTNPTPKNETSVIQGTPPVTPKNPKQAKPEFEAIFAAYVPKVVFALESELGRERCKRHARDIVHILADKELVRNSDPSSFELTPDRKKKVKGFVRSYMAKVIDHHQHRASNAGEATAPKRAKVGEPAA